MAFTLTILGSSSALPTSDRFTSAHILNVYEHFFLIDCGEGTQIRLRQNKIRFSRINHIFISHLHGDHFFGIFGLLSSFNILGRKNSLHIYSPHGLDSLIRQNIECSGSELTYPLIFHDLNTENDELVYSDKKIDIYSFPLNHRIPTCGFVFREKPKFRKLKKEIINEYQIPVKKLKEIKLGADYITDKGEIISNNKLTISSEPPSSYAYCSDTLYHPEIIKYIKDVSLLYHEATFLNNLIDRAGTTFHSTAEQAALIAKEAKVNKLIIGHYSVRYKNLDDFLVESRPIFQNTDLAIDGLQISF